MRVHLAAGLAASLLILSPAAGQPRPEQDGPTQHDMNVVAAQGHRAADEALNNVYGQLMAQASSGGRTRLRAAQRAWIRFRDLDCAARAGSRGGSFYPASLARCLEAATEDRTKTLRAELDCPEGDMSCAGHRVD
jgi:uncharacterized protein YecT (DUF1311 family)